jgi:glycosyltransferase involved in cell wall biosynthesis
MANVHVMPLGVLQHNLPAEPKGQRKRRFLKYFSKRISLATYGFFLPHKGLLEMIEAIALLRANGCQVSLDMVNAEYPIEASRALILEAQAKIQALGLKKYIKVKTDFLTDQKSIALLQDADLIVFPYQETGESASAAVRFGLVAGRPVAVTPLAIFDDVDAAVFRLPGFSAQAIAEGVQHLIKDLQAQTEATQDKLQSASAGCAAHAYPKVAARLTAMLKAPSP